MHYEKQRPTKPKQKIGTDELMQAPLETQTTQRSSVVIATNEEKGGKQGQ